MTYRSTPVAATGRSPAMMMTQREMQTLLPCLKRNLYPKSHPDVRIRDARYKATYQRNFNKRRGARPLSNLQKVIRYESKWVENNRKGATTVQHPKVISCGDRPRRCAEEKERKHLQAIPERPAQTQCLVHGT